MNVAERSLRRVDAFQQRHRPLAFVFGVAKKFGDDHGGVLVANLTYCAFVAIFPLLLIAVSVLGIVLAGHPGLQHDVQTSVLADIPVIGRQLLDNVHALHSHTVPTLAVGLLLLTWGSLGFAQAAIFATVQVWDVPGPERPGYLSRLGHSFGFLAVVALGVVASGFLAGIGVIGGHGAVLRVVGVGASALVNVGQYVAAFRVLTPKAIASRSLLPGAVCGGLVWTVVQAGGSYLVEHQLRHESDLYGTFSIVLGLLAWIYLGARISVYAAEINVVRQAHLWPRGLIQPPLTAADQASLTRRVLASSARAEQEVSVKFR